MNNQITHIAQLLVLFIFPAAIFAQSPEKEPLYFQTYTIEDGLPDNWVRGITQDQQGYLWIATLSGLSRFDGYAFEVFQNDPADSTSLSDNSVFAIHSDRKNNIWVATLTGIDRFERSTLTFSRFQVSINPIEASISHFYEAQDGTLYLTTTSGIIVYDHKQQKFRMITAETEKGPALSHPVVTSITESADGRLWIGTYGGGINILNPETGNITHLRHDPDDANSLPDDRVFAVFIDRDQVLWVNYHRATLRSDLATPELDTPEYSPAGLWKMNLSTGDSQHYLFEPKRGHLLFTVVSGIEQSRDGTLWFSQISGYEGGLTRYDDQKDAFFKYPYEENNPGTIAWNYTTAVLEDRFGNLWVGTSRGLNRADRNQLQMRAFTPVPENKYNINNNFYGISEISQNRFWISSDGFNGIIDWDRNINHWDVLPVTPSRVPFVREDDTTGWIINSTGTAIQRLNMQTFETTSFDLSATANSAININHFLRLADGNLLIATNYGLWKLDTDSGIFIKSDFKPPFINDEIVEIPYLAVDSTGNVWLSVNNTSLNASGSESGIVLAKYDPETGLSEFPDIDKTYLDAFGNGSVNHLFVNSRGHVWVSKTNGLVRFDPETGDITMYNQHNGLRHLIVLGTLEDDEGMMWILTRYGISRLNPNTGSIRNYGRDDGLRPVRMNTHSFYKRENGELMFGGVGGLSYFHPEDIRESDDPPLISLTRLETGETRVNLSGGQTTEEPIDIQWNSNSVYLEYVSVNFRNPGETTYSYKLEGFHNDWVDAGTRRFAQFSNLPPGSYTYHVRAVNADGITSTETASVFFTVLPPWWRTWWAYGIYLMFLIAGIITVDRIQRRRVQQKEREKAREKELAQAKEIEKAYQNLEVAHENLKAAQDQLVQQEKLASLGQLTAGIAHEIKNPLNFVNNFSEVSEEMITELIEALGKGDIDESLALSKDIGANLRKIHEHGSRADGIVKSMLMHSRGGDGKMEPTLLNPLIKEYVNLAFHGMRAGKESINVDIDLQLDESIGEVPLIAEDFSRVILNLCNNAFDACAERSRSAMREKVTGDGGPRTGYVPKLTVRTKSDNGTVSIEIEDNGHGIPDEIKDKILQPFFTTKKGTQGTGLGLSITHDIVKAHGGVLNISTQAGKRTTFTIELPK
jgi:signal transduction histidine kinase/ligand-binding sensor domain-containing protein